MSALQDPITIVEDAGFLLWWSRIALPEESSTARSASFSQYLSVDPGHTLMESVLFLKIPVARAVLSLTGRDASSRSARIVLQAHP